MPRSGAAALEGETVGQPTVLVGVWWVLRGLGVGLLTALEFVERPDDGCRVRVEVQSARWVLVVDAWLGDRDVIDPLV